MSSLTPRGYLVAGILIGLAIAGLYWISGHLWYVPDIDGGGHYCIVSMLKCYGADFH